MTLIAGKATNITSAKDLGNLRCRLQKSVNGCLQLGD
jgi:hypothetical protein